MSRVKVNRDRRYTGEDNANEKEVEKERFLFE